MGIQKFVVGSVSWPRFVVQLVLFGFKVILFIKYCISINISKTKLSVKCDSIFIITSD